MNRENIKKLLLVGLTFVLSLTTFAVFANSGQSGAVVYEGDDELEKAEWVISDLVDTINVMDLDITNLNIEIGDLENEITTLQNENSALENQNLMLIHTVRLLENHIVQLTEERDDLIVEKAELENELAVANTEIARLESELSRANQAAEDLEIAMCDSLSRLPRGIRQRYVDICTFD